MSAAGQVHVASDVAVANERTSAVDSVAPAAKERSPALPLLLLVTGLAAATFWFVALPLFDTPQSAPQACESFVLTNEGVIRCVPESTLGTAASRPQS